MKKQLHSKLQEIRKQVGLPIVVMVGIPEEGHFDILGIQCLGQADDQQKRDVEEDEEELAEYIG